MTTWSGSPSAAIGPAALEDCLGNEWIEFRIATDEEATLYRPGLILIVGRSGVIQSAYESTSPAVEGMVARDLKSIMLGANLAKRPR